MVSIPERARRAVVRTYRLAPLGLRAARDLAKRHSPAVSVLLWALAWLVLADLLVATGALWWAFGDDFSGQRRYSMQARLFDQPPPDSIDLLVVGDRAFVQWLEEERPELMASAYSLPIPQFSLADLSALAPAFRGYEIRNVVIQSSPHLWTDYWYREPALDTKLWRDYGGLRGPSTSRIELVFTVLNQAVRATSAKPLGPDRPESLLAAHPSNEPRHANRIERDLKALVDDVDNAVFWLRDEQMTPSDTPPAVLEDFDRRMAPDGMPPEYGQAVRDPKALAPRDRKSSRVR